MKLKKLYGTNVFLGERDLKDDGASKQLPSGEWVKSRSIGWVGLGYRIKFAWRVLRGYADIVVWEHNS